MYLVYKFAYSICNFLLPFLQLSIVAYATEFKEAYLNSLLSFIWCFYMKSRDPFFSGVKPDYLFELLPFKYL